ncbi:CRISPR-associated protein CasA/Cse1, type I-E [Leptospira noguchii str. 2006001870]|uniref:type I-E CRISPR-associated protein Cse1/CasA n=1 Tax=Leptospira noguchii TaxID=28182 RepID=UPI0002489B0E|nr:type I-E CRISPR-associated protein Cse1/CasA [Leptospira noguchii]EKR75188.1 CRISPR-associated protein CasA/Cse1, type I-E [Leptospira noguchii str. 2006001870]
MPDFSFNLLTEPWIPVVHKTSKKQLLNLNDFLRTAHKLERFDFPLPGLETAVIRFLVALVHIVGAPETLKEWEEKLSKGKFEESFIKELNEKYFDKLDLFSKKDPFMQERISDEKFIKPISKLIDEFPSGNNSIHFSPLEQKTSRAQEMQISATSAAALLLYANMTPRSGLGGFLSGVINAKTPYFILLKGKNLFESVYLNVIHQSQYSDNIGSKQIGKNDLGWPKKYEGQITLDKINIQNGLLWKSRSILLIPYASEAQVCIITGNRSSINIKKIFYAPQIANLTPKTLWSDPYQGVIQIKNKIKKTSPTGKSMPIWKDYPAFIFFEEEQKEKIKRTPPLVITRILQSKLAKKFDISIFVFGVFTKQDKVFQATENSFPFVPKFVENEDFTKSIKYFIIQTANFEKHIQSALIKSLIKDNEKISRDRKKKITDNIRNSFQSSYWQEIGSNFEQTLQRLSSEDDPNLVQNEWNELLANHVRKTFYKHTEKLIRNPKNLKQYQAGYQFLEKRVQGILLKHKRESK